MKRSSTALCTFYVTTAAMLTACSADSSRMEEAAARDSAGVAILQNSAPTWSPAETWRIAAEPVLHIGTAEGAEAYSLHDVREARLLSDGRVLVVSGSQLRYFGADGRHLATVGRSGDGPSEFRAITAVVILPGDTVLIVDRPQRRMTLIDPAGGFVTSFDLPSDRAPAPGGGPPTLAEFVGRFEDGSLLMSRAAPFRQEFSDGPQVAEVNYQRFSPSGETIRDLGDFPFTQLIVEHQRAQVPHFGRQASVIVAGDRLYYAWNERYEVRVYRADGTLERIVRKEHRPESTSPQHRAELVGFLREWATQEGEQIPEEEFEQFTHAPMAETVPPFSTIWVDDEGNLWVLGYDIRDLPGQGGGAGIWDVFDPRGFYLGSVTTPAELRITQIGPDFILGVWRDELNVEFVRKYDLLKPQG